MIRNAKLFPVEYPVQKTSYVYMCIWECVHLIVFFYSFAPCTGNLKQMPWSLSWFVLFFKPFLIWLLSIWFLQQGNVQTACSLCLGCLLSQDKWRWTQIPVNHSVIVWWTISCNLHSTSVLCSDTSDASKWLKLGFICLQRLELSSIWALLAAFEEPLSLKNHSSIPFEGAFVRGDDALSWMANNTKKLFPMQSHGPECWTFFSSAAYGKRNKVPQVVRLFLTFFFC